MSRTVQSRALSQTHLSAEVASLLPNAALEGRHRADNVRTTRDGNIRTTICPRCGGSKGKQANICAVCRNAESKAHGTYITKEKSIRLGTTRPHPEELRPESTRHMHTAGTRRAGPPQTRRAFVDGKWVEQAWDADLTEGVSSGQHG